MQIHKRCRCLICGESHTITSWRRTLGEISQAWDVKGTGLEEESQNIDSGLGACQLLTVPEVSTCKTVMEKADTSHTMMAIDGANGIIPW